MTSLLAHTQSLFNHIYWFQQKFDIKPQKDHWGSSIEWTDISERKDDFINELINTITGWVYGKKKSNSIIKERLKIANGDERNATSFLTRQAFSKFRPGLPQGQVGELLLFNFIQHFFKAAPLLRKQKLTTSIGHERFGVDAVHYKEENGKHILILGESKCYESKYKFKEAFKISLNSIKKSVKSFNKELDLYVYDDFIEPELENIAKQYKQGQLKGLHFELLCLVVYNESQIRNGSNESEIKASIKGIIEDRCSSIDKALFNDIDTRILDRISYVIFPIWELDKLLDEFSKLVGSQ